MLPERYADTAVALLMEEMAVVGAPYKEYQVKLFGGGSMFPETNKNGISQLGIQNVQAARRLAQQYGFRYMAEHLDDIGHRNVIFEVWSGEVWVKHTVVSIAGLETIERRLG